ncbi:MAG: DUF1491 family protein [Novosphingobium sp.]|nr:DUF1491 family protein [Novosphingobium sp.]
MDARLPSALEVSALLRSTQAEGGFATVLAKGEPDSGSILIVLAKNGENLGAYERMPQLDGTRKWACSKQQTTGIAEEFADYLNRRRHQDPDLWLIELDVASGERFIDSLNALD